MDLTGIGLVAAAEAKKAIIIKQEKEKKRRNWIILSACIALALIAGIVIAKKL